MDGVYVMGLDEDSPRQIANIAAYGPAWSPDGHWVAFSHYVDGRHELWALTDDGAHARRLLSGPANAPTWGITVEA